MKDFDVTIYFDATEFNRALEHIIEGFKRLAAEADRVKKILENLGDYISFRKLSTGGRWALAIALKLGFARKNILKWLEECPGAYQDEFGEGWQS